MLQFSNRCTPAHAFFNEFFDAPAFEGRGERSHAAGISVYEKDTTLYVRADLPGVKKEEIKLEVKDGYLLISAERKVEVDKEAKVYAWGAREYNFNKRVKLPHAIDQDKIDAKHENGVLTVSIPAAEEAKPKSVVIN